MRVPVECGEGEIKNDDFEDDDEGDDNDKELAIESKMNKV